jgi:ABC-type uncharacterized transport system substrate-binding protein
MERRRATADLTVCTARRGRAELQLPAVGTSRCSVPPLKLGVIRHVTEPGDRVNRRRALFAIVSLGLGLSAARESSAQLTGKAAALGLLDAGERLDWWAVFRQELRDLGYVEAQNVAFQRRFAGGKFERLPALAEELVRLKVAVIVTSGTVAAQAAKQATSTIPIVMATGSGTEETMRLARPGANVTGVTSLSTGLTGKRFELIQEVVPKISRLAVLWHRGGSALALRELEAAARSAKVALQVLGVTTADEFAGAFFAMTKERARAVFVIADPMFFSERQRISDLAIKHRLPSIHGPSEYVEAGGLLSYGPSYPDLFRRAAVYVDKILKGAKPGDLPIEQPTKFELVVNLKTARTLGVTIPRSILLRAARVIE